MTNALRSSLPRRLSALLLALLMALGSLVALAAPVTDPVSFTLSWTGADGQPQTQTALAVPYPDYAGSYWLYAPAEAISQSPVLLLSDNFAQYPGGFSIPSGQPLANLPYVDAGGSLQQGAMPVYAYDASNNVLATFQLYISTMAPEPEAPVAEVTPLPEVPKASVIVRFVDAASMIEIAAPQQVADLGPGPHEIMAQPTDLPQHYTLAGAQSQTVNVDANGIADKTEVVFTYNYEAPKATVNIRFVDAATMIDVASPQQQGDLAPGAHEIVAQPADLQPHYTPAGAQSQTVNVDANGIADKTEVVFTYNYEAPKASVTIRYVDAVTMIDVASPQQQGDLAPGAHEIMAQPADLQPHYTPAGAQSQTVNVDANGIADKSEVVFTYNYEAPKATVTIRYVDAATMIDVASPQQKGDLAPGAHEIVAQPSDLQPHYTPAGAQSQTVNVDDNGNADMTEVVFTYNYEAPKATVTIRYVDAATMQDIATAQQQGDLGPGSHSIEARPEDLPIHYHLVGDQTQTVTVDADGNPDRVEVVFNYNYEVPKASITIRYVDAATMLDVASPQQQADLGPGPHEIQANPTDLQQYYVLAGAPSQTVNVDANGLTDKAELVFSYDHTPPTEVPTEVPTEAPTAVPTEEPIQPAVLRVYYRDAQGADLAQMQEKTLEAGQHTVQPEPVGLPDSYEPLQAQPQLVEVTRQGANPPEIVFTYQLKVTQAPVTQAPVTEAPVQPVKVTVQYLDEAGTAIADSQEVEVQPGTHPVTARPAPADYEPLGDQVVDVTVTAQGASPATVVFRYRYVQPVAPQVDVPVRYVDEQGQPVASQQIKTLNDGTNTVAAEPTDLKQGYELVGEATQFVIVSQQGANPSAVTFVYRLPQQPATQAPATASPAPAPKVALVPVLYKDQFGSVLYQRSESVSEGTPTTIHVDLSVLEAGRYALNDAQQKTVSVDANGVATPAELVFQFSDNRPNITLPINVHYRDEAGAQLALSTQQTLKLGVNDVLPAPAEAITGYTLISQSPVQVNLGADGKASHAEVAFVYRKDAPPATAVPTQMPYDVAAMDGYAYPKGNEIRFRSSPRIDDQNIIMSLGQQDLVKLTGSLNNEKGEPWYTVEYDGKTGFMSANFVRVLTQTEIDAVFGYTPAPTAEPTAQPSAIPTDAPIDLWAEVNKNKVNYRNQPDASTAKTLITQLNKGDKLWIYQQEQVDGVLWYRATASGKDGYIQSEFVTIYDQASSDAYQQSLPSPVPEQTVAPTEVPATPAPTEVPATQAPAATLTPLPEVYKGYAMTNQQVALRTGARASEETKLADLSEQTLVYIWGQTYVDGVTWDHVDVLVSSQSGYVIDSALRRIDTAEADYQRSLLQPKVSPSPVVTQVPPKVTGFALTLGDNVPMRSYIDTNAQISRWLKNNTVVAVTGQEYSPDATWHVVQYAGQYGFIRADQLRMMTTAEAQNYLESLKVTPVIPQATPAPYTQNSLSSYGYVNVDKVRLRKEPTTNSAELKMMDKNAFALVLSSSQQNDGLWYEINQGGTQGYVMGKYFTVLPISQLSQYLTSTEYLNANTGVSIPAGGTGSPSQGITPVEDFNAGVWQNPALAQASYEPFNPMGTATPEVETILSPTIDPEATPEASPTLDPLATFEPMGTEPPTKEGGSFPVGWLALGIIGVLGGGGYYAYRMYQENQRRAAQRAQQRRQQAQAPGQRPAQPGTQTPYTRPAGQATPPQSGQQPGQGGQGGGGQPSPYTPPRPGAQGTTTYRPVTPPTQPGAQPPAQGTTTYRPVTPPAQPGHKPPAQGTTTYRPVTPPAQPGQQPPAQGTTTYRPVTPPTQPGAQPPAQGTTTYRPVTPPTQPGQQPPAQSTTTYRPVTPSNQPGQQAPQGEPKPPQGEEGSQGAERRRRSERRGQD